MTGLRIAPEQSAEKDAELDTERCRRCGGTNVIWSAASPLWNYVMRGNDINGEPRYSDLVCMPCFIICATEAGLPEKGWRLTLVPEPEGLIYQTPSGRIWDPERFLWTAVDGHAAHVAAVEARHPHFGAFLRRATEDPEVREAYYAAQSRRDGEDSVDSPAGPGRIVEPSDSDTNAGLEGEAGGAPATSGLEASPEPAGEVGRARTGLKRRRRMRAALATGDDWPTRSRRRKDPNPMSDSTAVEDALMQRLHPQLALYGIDATNEAHDQIDDILTIVHRHGCASTLQES